MEIAEYLRVARRSLWVLIAVPLGAALLAGGFVLLSPATYQATASVDLPLGSGKSPYAGTHGQVLYVDAFRTAATSTPVVTAVAARTGANPKSLVNKLLVKQVGSSSVMSISYPAPTKAQAAAVVDAVATATLDRILQNQANAAKPTVQVAIDARRPLLEREAELTQKAGGVPPDKAIRTVQLEINSLKRQQGNLQAHGKDPVALAAVATQLKAAQARLAAYRPMALEYQTLKTEMKSADQNVTKQTQVSQAIAGLQRAAKSPTTVTVTSDKKLPVLPTLMTVCLAAAGAGAFLALGIIAVMELMARRRRPVTDAQSASVKAVSDGGQSGTEPYQRHPATAKETATATAERRPWSRAPSAAEGDSSATDTGAGSQQSEGLRLPLKPK